MTYHSRTNSSFQISCATDLPITQKFFTSKLLRCGRPTTHRKVHQNRGSTDQFWLCTFRRKKKTTQPLRADKFIKTSLKKSRNLSCPAFIIVFLIKHRKQRILYLPKTEKREYAPRSPQVSNSIHASPPL